MYWILKTRFRTMVATAGCLLAPVGVVVIFSRHGDPAPWVLVVWFLSSMVLIILFPVVVWMADRHYRGDEGLRDRVRALLNSLPQKG